MTRRAWRAYWAFARIAAARTRHAPAELYGRVLFFVVILGIFSSLWKAIAAVGMPIAVEPKTLVWYLAITEWILLSAPPVHFEVSESIRRGDVAYQLGRPVSFVGAVLAEGLGTLAVRGPVLFLTACVTATAFTGWIPPVGVLVGTFVLGCCAAGLLTALYIGIGLVSFWLGDIAPVWWVFQKALFVLGGLMMPLVVYPGALQRVAVYTPFPAAVGGPATLVLGAGSGAAVTVGVRLVLWSVVTGVGLRWVFHRAAARLSVNGG